MPKGRMISKKISYDEKVALLSLPAKILYTWCIPHLDVKGRIYAEPQILKGIVVPYVKELTPTKIEKSIQEIAEAGLADIYGSNKQYMLFKGFSKNQNLREDREAESEIPPPTPEQLQSNSRQTPAQVKLSKDKIIKEYCPTSEEVRLAKLLFSLIRGRKPNYQVKIKSEKQKEALYQKWADHIDKLIRIDERGPAQIEAVIRWCQKDDFWKDNILSTEKLREKIDKLELKMAKPEAKYPNFL